MHKLFIFFILLFIFAAQDKLSAYCETSCYCEAYCDACCPECVEYIETPPAACCSEQIPCFGPYVGLFGGIDQTCLIYDRFTQVYYPYFMGGLSLGYKFPRFFRTEVEFAYRQNELFFRHLKENYNIYSGMFNFYFEAPIGRLTPFIGLGAGYANTTVDVHPRCQRSFHCHYNRFAWQFLFGLNYRVCPKIDIGIKEVAFYQNPFSKYNLSLAFTLNQYF